MSAVDLSDVGEHLRQHERQTAADRAIFEAMSITLDGLAMVSHLIRAD